MAGIEPNGHDSMLEIRYKLDGPMETKNAPTLKEKAYAYIRNKIVTCELMPGAVVDQNQLVEEIGVSKTPVREAVNALESEGLLIVMPRRGVIVAPISVGDVAQIYTVREVVEPFVARLATKSAERARLQTFHELFTKEKEAPMVIVENDFLLHSYLVESTGNQYLIRLMHNVLSQNMRIVVLGARIENRLPASNSEHAEIIERMLDGDAGGAEEAMRRHIASAKAIASLVNKIEL